MINVPRRFTVEVSAEYTSSGIEKYVAESRECGVRGEGHTAYTALSAFARQLEPRGVEPASEKASAAPSRARPAPSARPEPEKPQPSSA